MTDYQNFDMHSPAKSAPLPQPFETGSHAFAASLLPGQRDALQRLRAQALQEVPEHCIAFRCGSQVLGHLLPDHGMQLARVLQNTALRADALVWNAQDDSATVRSAALQSALVKLHAQGLISGWRNEEFCYWPDPQALPDPAQPAFVRVERAGFRYTGMMSHAVHINGFTPDGRMWCGQRSASKATDPGLWDSMTAGGLNANETLEHCAVRELWEEAGLRAIDPRQLRPAGKIRGARMTPTGWHDEMLHVYNLQLAEGFTPLNQDGEVQAFACLNTGEVLTGIASGRWTVDATLALAQGVLNMDQR